MTQQFEARSYIENLDENICCPFFDKFGALHVVFSETGQVAVIRDMTPHTIHNTNGHTSGAAFDANGALYMTDFTQGAVLVSVGPEESTQPNKDFRNETQDVFVSVYEDKPLKGPSAIAFDKAGNIFFTDSGPFGETGINSPAGSLFSITSGVSTRILKPIVLEKLAGPSDVAVSPVNNFVYITEMMANRVLRFVEKPTGKFVFYFSWILHDSLLANTQSVHSSSD